MAKEDFIDLTLTDTEDERQPKRSRFAGRGTADSSEVRIVEERPARRAPEADVDLNEDGIAIVSVAGGEDWTALPHTRDLCTAKHFRIGLSTGNALFCSRCFCYVCDRPAGECTAWGTGSSRGHHCNAHPKSVSYKEMRAIARSEAGPRPSSAGAAGGAAAAGAAAAAAAPSRPAGPSGASRPADAADMAALDAQVAEARASELRSVQAATKNFQREVAQQRARALEEMQRQQAAVRAAAAAAAAAARWDNGEEEEEEAAGGCAYGRHRGRSAFGCFEPLEPLGYGGGVCSDSDNESSPYESDDDRMGGGGSGGGMYNNLPYGGRPQGGPPEKCTLKEMPSPVGAPDMFEVADMSFQMELRGNAHTVKDVAERLSRYGYYTPQSAGKTIGNRLTIDSMSGEFYSYMTRHSQDLPALEFIVADTAPLPTPPGPTRVRPVAVHYSDGRDKPTIYGVTMAASVTVAEVIEALHAQLGLTAADALVPFYRSASGRFVEYVKPTEVIDDKKAGDVARSYFATLGAFCVPALPGRHASSAKSSKRPANYLLVGFEREMDRMRRMYGAGFGVSEGEPSSSKEPLPLALIPLPEVARFAGSPRVQGLASHSTVMDAVLAALRPFRRSLDDTKAETRLRSGATLDWGGGSRRSGDANSPVTHIKVLVSSGGAGGSADSQQSGCSQRVTVNWAPDVVEELFDLDGWQGSITDPSASPSALKETEGYLTALREHARAQDLEKRMPRNILSEVARASATEDPADVAQRPPTSVMYLSRMLPHCRYVAELHPASDDADERKGTLRLRVFAWRSATAAHKSFFQEAEVWEASTTRGGRRRACRTIGRHPLAETLRWSLQNSAQYAALHASWSRWVKREGDLASSNKKRGIAGLMEALETPEGPAARQPTGLTVTMRPYQLQSLQFMLDSEARDGGFRAGMWAHVAAADGTPFWYSPILGRASRKVEALPRGGFCCEEMGLGKTVEVLALCLANPAPVLPASGTVGAGGRYISRATLVVCAVSLVGQWMEEARSKTRGSLKMHMYHGSGRIKDPKTLATEFDLVVTTYATLSADFGAKKGNGIANSPLHKVQWHRLVLDESHTCKNPAVGHTKACVALEAERRWLCTGTPVNTDVGDLFGQFAVLRYSPFCQKPFFDANVKHSFSNDFPAGGCIELLHAMAGVTVRHTKQQEVAGQQVLQLPPMSEELVPVVLTVEEQAAYKRAHATSNEYFNRYVNVGAHFVSRNLLHIMSLLQPMRRICSGGALTVRDLTVAEPDVTRMEEAQSNASAPAAANGVKVPKEEGLIAPAGEECPICMDAFEEPAMTSCKHWFCEKCIVAVVVSSNAKCPLCRGPQRINQLRGGILAADAAEDDAQVAEAVIETREAEVAATGGVLCDSKLRALLQKLREMRRADPTAKAIVFSHYNATIEWLKARLSREGFGHRHISGSMPLKQRAKAIQAFQGDPPTTVFLLSMRSGAVGINLTAASHVFLLEPALNPALEEQAIGRAWRMGQRREVKVMRFYVKGSVEERMMEVVKQKYHGGAGASAVEGGARINPFYVDAQQPRRARNRVRVEDVAGSIKADKQNLRLSELQELFKAPEFPAPRVPAGESSSSEEEDERVDRHGTCARGMDVDEEEGADAQQIPQAWAASRDVNGVTMEGVVHGTSHIPAAATKARMRRSKAGIAAIASAAAGGGTAAGASSPPPPPEVQRQRQRQVPVEEERPPAEILEHIKKLKAKVTGRLTPAMPADAAAAAAPDGATCATAATSPAAAAAAAQAPPRPHQSTGGSAAVPSILKTVLTKTAKKRSRAEAAEGGGAAALAAHIPGATPGCVSSGVDSDTGSGLASARRARRMPRRDYAAMDTSGMVHDE